MVVGCVVTPTLSRGFPICQLSQSLTTFDLRDNNQTPVIPLLFKNRKAHFQTLLRGGVTDGSNMLIDFIVNKGLALWLGLGYLWGGVVEIRLRGQGGEYYICHLHNIMVDGVTPLQGTHPPSPLSRRAVLSSYITVLMS